MMEDGLPITIELFITLVEDRPVIWDKSLDEYKNKIATQNAWKEILLIIYPDFNTWDEKKRQQYAKKALKKWTYIRDTFTKSEKKIEEQKASGSGAKTAKPYVYHKQLSFLKKNIQLVTPVSSMTIAEATKETNEDNTADAGNNDLADTDSDRTIESIDTNDNVPERQQNSNDIQTEPTQANAIRPPNLKRKKSSASNLSLVDAKMISFMDSYQSQPGPINRHVSFFNGLIPTLDKFNDDQILDFQLGVIKLMKDIKNKTSAQEQTPSRGSCHSSMYTGGYFTANYENVSTNHSSESRRYDRSPPSQDSLLSSYSSDDGNIDFSKF